MPQDQDLGPPVSTKPAAAPSRELTLIGKYVRLEGLCKAHMPSLFANLGLPSVFDWLAFTIPADSEDELWDLFDKLHKDRGFILYAIKADSQRLNPQTKSTSSQSNRDSQLEVLGTIGYFDVNLQHRSLETGAVLFGPALRRSAAATEAHYLLLRALCDSDPSSDSPPFRRISWKCNRLNIASRRAAERIGYVYEGTFRNHMISKGYSRDSDWLSIIDDEWPTVREALELWLDESNFDAQGRQLRTLENIRADIVQ